MFNRFMSKALECFFHISIFFLRIHHFHFIGLRLQRFDVAASILIVWSCITSNWKMLYISYPEKYNCDKLSGKPHGAGRILPSPSSS